MYECYYSRVKDMMKRSFAEIDSVRSESYRMIRLNQLKKLESESDVNDCSNCMPSINDYYQRCCQISEINNRMQVSKVHAYCIFWNKSLHYCFVSYQCIYIFMQALLLSFPQALKTLLSGRVLTIYVSKYKHLLAVVLQRTQKKSSELLLTVLLLCNKDDDDQTSAQNLVDKTIEDMKHVQVFERLKDLYLPDPPLKHAVVDIPGQLLVNITSKVIKIDPLMIIDDYKKRQMARFR